MFPHALFHGGLATGRIDLTTDFAPLFVGMWVLLSLCVLAFAFAIGVHDTREAQQKTDRVPSESISCPKAA
jgi:hypothetical protein